MPNARSPNQNHWVSEEGVMADVVLKYAQYGYWISVIVGVVIAAGLMLDPRLQNLPDGVAVADRMTKAQHRLFWVVVVLWSWPVFLFLLLVVGAIFLQLLSAV